MGFVEGTRPQFSHETAGLLRSRLQAASLVLSIALAFGLASDFFSEYAPLFGIWAIILGAFIGGFPSRTFACSPRRRSRHVHDQRHTT